jgi:WhiB family redox-sensing transcriptional regulator
VSTRGNAYVPELELTPRLSYLLRLIGEEGACNGLPVEVFYPEDHGGSRYRKLDKAREVCAGCPVQAECLEYALGAPEDVGVWGGLSERQRRKLQGPRGNWQANKTHCKSGHPFSGDNLRINPKTNQRVCLTCQRQALERHRQSQRAS